MVDTHGGVQGRTVSRNRVLPTFDSPHITMFPTKLFGLVSWLDTGLRFMLVVENVVVRDLDDEGVSYVITA